MGAPDYAPCDLAKDGGKFVGSMWQCAVAVPQDPANDGSQDGSIQIMFGPDGKVMDKSAMNMQPSPTPTPSPVATPTPDSAQSPAASPTPIAIATPSAIPVVTATPANECDSASATPGSNGESDAAVNLRIQRRRREMS